MGELEIFANRIKQLRNSLNMTQKDFSEYIGIKQQTLSGYERGIIKPPLDIAKNIAEKCCVSMDWLCGIKDQKEFKLEINNYKDIALILLEISKIGTFPNVFELKECKLDGWDKYFRSDNGGRYRGNSNRFALIIPPEEKLLNFFSANKELNRLYEKGQIKQDIVTTWYNGALEELKEIPINIPFEEFDEEHSNILDEPPQE